MNWQYEFSWFGWLTKPTMLVSAADKLVLFGELIFLAILLLIVNAWFEK